MALTGGQTVVGTVATLIDGNAWQNPVVMHIHNDDNTDAVYIGGTGVAVNNGLKLNKEESVELTLHQANLVYAVSNKAGHVISWIRQPL